MFYLKIVSGNAESGRREVEVIPLYATAETKATAETVYVDGKAALDRTDGDAYLVAATPDGPVVCETWERVEVAPLTAGVERGGGWVGIPLPSGISVKSSFAGAHTGLKPDEIPRHHRYRPEGDA